MQFTRPTHSMVTTPTTMPASQMLSGPSHQYDQYKQQTPFVPGALANTLAINEGSVPMTGYNMDFLSPGNDMFDFNSPQDSLGSNNMDLDFETNQAEFLYGTTPNINPHTIPATSPSVASQASNPPRVYPGYHSNRQAMAKAQAQAQAQQQQQIAMLRSQMGQQAKVQPSKSTRPKTAEAEDPIVQQKITQLLNSMRSKVNSSDLDDNSPLVQIPRQKKDDEEMDDDERLLASEEGKKLSSKERRQLRNKVSARAFRSRRKEYITQLESEVAGKVKENNDLRAENQAIKEENQRLSDLVQILLQSSHFQGFLNDMASNPAALQSKPRMEQRQVKTEPNHAVKDPNPYNAMSMGQQQQIGMVMMPEQNMDFGVLNMNHDNFGYQPRVFAVLETPELPNIDTELLMGKSSNFVGGSCIPDSDKIDLPSLEAPIPSVVEKPQEEVKVEPAPAEQRVPNLDGDIFDDDEQSDASVQPLELDTDGFSAVDMFGGIEPEKAFARYDLVDSSEEELAAARAVTRVEGLRLI
ncbi:hypothetical protein NPX13_g8300 [Xylaria arbuscula]|uniref:BZIP domain-containing protein n=1 Tax=Xylaria arbuscula TaxID=114810 RepID=A0A9W8TIH2_9PEZI|nr:hypothetical protein NPX13_g8300 [Xylaria arbuscula]